MSPLTSRPSRDLGSQGGVEGLKASNVLSAPSAHDSIRSSREAT